MERKQVRDFVSKWAESGVTKVALGWLSSVWGLAAFKPVRWLIEETFIYIWNKTGDRALRWLFINGYYVVDRIEGTIKAKRVENAENQQDYDDAVDDIFR